MQRKQDGGRTSEDLKFVAALLFIKINPFKKLIIVHHLVQVFCIEVDVQVLVGGRELLLVRAKVCVVKSLHCATFQHRDRAGFVLVVNVGKAAKRMYSKCLKSKLVGISDTE